MKIRTETTHFTDMTTEGSKPVGRYRNSGTALVLFAAAVVEGDAAAPSATVPATP